jgi:hypothetical protein
LRNCKKVLLPVDSFARRKKEEGRRKKEEGRRKKEEGSISVIVGCVRSECGDHLLKKFLPDAPYG